MIFAGTPAAKQLSGIYPRTTTAPAPKITLLADVNVALNSHPRTNKAPLADVNISARCTGVSSIGR